jgi:hypothetical protein
MLGGTADAFGRDLSAGQKRQCSHSDFKLCNDPTEPSVPNGDGNCSLSPSTTPDLHTVQRRGLRYYISDEEISRRRQVPMVLLVAFFYSCHGITK